MPLTLRRARCYNITVSDFYYEQMKELLGGAFDDFVRAYETAPRHKALRVNTLKISVGAFVELAEKYEAAGLMRYGLTPNPLCDRSFYTCVKPSADPLYHAGLYYMQEPSASAAVAAFAPFIGERVLDLCAAPGGKSTQAAAFMNGGTIFCNDIVSSRVHALTENIDRLGVKNAVVTHTDAKRFRRGGYVGYFDTLIVDAPCSGGGMMRYEDVPYSPEIVAGCAARQREILDDAAELLRRGGYMLYSTCTFSQEENEQNVKYLIDKGFEPVETPLLPGVERGIGVPEARRIYPHRFDGEGHFYCVLQKTTGGVADISPVRAAQKKTEIGGLSLDCARLNVDTLGTDIEIPAFSLPILRIGAEIYDRVQKRTLDKKTGKTYYKRSYSYALSHALSVEQVRAAGSVELGYVNAQRYIRGEQLDIAAPRGEFIATVDGYALGFVKCADDGAGNTVLKNLYPKSLRI